MRWMTWLFIAVGICSGASFFAAASSPSSLESTWAFVPVHKPALPATSAGVVHPVDRFIAEGWRERRLEPVGQAERRTLLRRLYFDLLGLPPTPGETEAFLADGRADAFESTMERLLASPRYGERWGRYWLDVARYADTAGDNADYPVPEARLYRDYVIDSFNADKPYNEFVQEQLAGDILARAGGLSPARYAECVTATGFLALSRRYATAPYEFWHLTLEDTIDTVGQAFMGLTLKCARCHDHKFDPVTMRDYYALYGVFESTQFPWAGGEEFASKSFPREHFVPLICAEEATPRLLKREQRLQELTNEISRCEKGLAQALSELEQNPPRNASTSSDSTKARVATERASLKKSWDDRLAALRKELSALRRPGYPPDVPSAYAVSEGSVHRAALQRRGDPEMKGPLVERGSIACLARELPLAIPTNASGRLELARWLTRPEHPLTARVMVNRLWQHHFGQGLVATPSNFGVRGARPTHGALLDWLAATFVEQHWSLKTIHRLILTSRTWQRASQHSEANAQLDPNNDFYWRQNRRRLDAEAIRDSMLWVSGRLDLRRPGTHPFPAIADWGYTQHNQFKAIYPSQHRTVYLMTPRLQRHPFLALFDGPDPNTSTDRRTSATVPLQALYLMNSGEVRQEAHEFARRILSFNTDESRQVTFAYEWAFSRLPSREELERALEYLRRYRADGGSGDVRLLNEGRRPAVDSLEAWTSYARVLLTVNEFFYVD